MTMKQEIHLDRGVLMLGPVKPQGDQRLKELVDETADELRALGLDNVTVTNPAARTYQIDATWTTERQRNWFRRTTAATEERAEADPRIEWGGPG